MVEMSPAVCVCVFVCAFVCLFVRVCVRRGGWKGEGASQKSANSFARLAFMFALLTTGVVLGWYRTWHIWWRKL